MEMKQKLAIKSYETQKLLKITFSDNRNLLETAIFKIAALYNLARRHNVYAFIRLMEIYHPIDTLLSDLKDHSRKFKKIIKNQNDHLPNIVFPIQEHCQIEFGNPIHFGLIQVIQNFDDCVAWLVLTKNNHAFSHQNKFYGLRNSIRKSVFKLVSEIACINLKDFPAINFNQYFGQDALYQKAAEIHGEINPQELYNAIHSSITPALTQEELNKATERLRKKAAN